MFWASLRLSAGGITGILFPTICHDPQSPHKSIIHRCTFRAQLHSRALPQTNAYQVLHTSSTMCQCTPLAHCPMHKLPCTVCQCSIPASCSQDSASLWTSAHICSVMHVGVVCSHAECQCNMPLFYDTMQCTAYHSNFTPVCTPVCSA